MHYFLFEKDPGAPIQRPDGKFDATSFGHLLRGSFTTQSELVAALRTARNHDDGLDYFTVKANRPDCSDGEIYPIGEGGLTEA